jgi:hypothetical protein
MGEPATEVEEGFKRWDSQLILRSKSWETMWVPEVEWIGASMGGARYSFWGAGLFQLADERDDSVGAFEAFE